MSNQERVRRSTRVRCRESVLDLNVVPPSENQGQEGTSSHTWSQDTQAGQEREVILPEPIDLEAIDDDIIISSPRTFAEAKSNTRRNRGRTVVVDVESDERSSRNKRKMVPPSQTIINCDLYINLEGSGNPVRDSGQSTSLPFSHPQPQKEPLTFSCPICMGPLKEEMSTKCGHIFCKGCIKAVIAAQNKCPTCRKKITMKELIRIYLPATTTS